LIESNIKEEYDFEKILDNRIHQYFKSQSLNRKADNQAWIKIWILVLFWVLSLFMIYSIKTTFIGYVGLYLLHGIASLLVIFNISHDAVHQTLSEKKWINDIFGYTFNVVGGNKYAWYLKHNIGHHKFTNIHGRDIDIETTPFFRVSPHTTWRWYYRFQHFYILPLYCLMSLLLIFVFDFLALIKIKPRNKKKHSVNEWIALVGFKIFYIFYIVILPINWLPIAINEVVVCFLLMHALVGLVISLVLLSSHFIENVIYYKAIENSKLPSSWAIHQLNTTVDISPESKIINFILGGLNANVIHHIYPAIHHCHLVPLVKILKTTALEYKAPYKLYPYFQAIKLHFIFLKRMGKFSDI